MISHLNRILHTQFSHLIEDAIGIFAIFVVLYVGLTLPGLT